MPPLLTFYGDDFTGSSAVMEVLSFAGVPTMLFLQPPTPEMLKHYPNLQAIGVAGLARSKDPSWMRAELPKIFAALKRFKAPVTHYKVCSTFDSSPEVGSIGTAAEIGADVFGSDWMPLIVGAPAIRRYQAFGNLFAGAGAENHRLDRHPVMSRHPVTPMQEADLCLHLSAQTKLVTGVVDLAAMKAGQTDHALQSQRDRGARIIALDVIDDETLIEAGRVLWQNRRQPIFAVGSQGVEYALVAHWRHTGAIAPDFEPQGLSQVDQIFAVSGSCAPTTADQIAYAEANSFKVLEFDASLAIDPDSLSKEVARLCDASIDLLNKGHDVLVATARGADDPALHRMAHAIKSSALSAGDVNARLGQALGRIVSLVRKKTGQQRIIVAGGDTSGHALTALGAQALSAITPLAPGAPLCRVHCQDDPDIDGLEVSLKGGQMGAQDFFVAAKG
ncbi:MAG: four-carbon acid sugar kinase family protein [Marivita sp.]|uniref:four-carbon acid sugar kinase family protein n=1 Tax=Marivita sp. TaxID=2003365 RepID=UPI003EF74087